MLMLPATVRVFVATQPTDLRQAFDTLAETTRRVLACDPLSGHLFVFFNRARNRVKILVWERSGFWLWHKRLESGTFRMPSAEGVVRELDAAELLLILEGLDLSHARRRVRYRRPETLTRRV